MLFDRGDLWVSLVVCGAGFGRRLVEADAFISNLDGEYGSQKNTSVPVRAVESSWRVISRPWSQVRVFRRCSVS